MRNAQLMEMRSVLLTLLADMEFNVPYEIVLVDTDGGDNLTIQITKVKK